MKEGDFVRLKDVGVFSGKIARITQVRRDTHTISIELILSEQMFSVYPANMETITEREAAIAMAVHALLPQKKDGDSVA